MKSILVLAAAATTISSTALADTRGVEGVFGFFTEKDGVTFQVYSGGCTGVDDFELRVTPAAAAALPIVTLVRTSPDYFRAFLPHGTLVKFPFADNGLAGVRFELANPVRGPWIDLGRK